MPDYVLPKPQEGPQTKFSQIKDDVYAVLYGGGAGGGKSYSLVLDPLKYIDCPKFKAIIVRKTMRQIDLELWPLAVDMYMPFLIYHTGPNKGKFKGKARIGIKDHKITFPSGATVIFSYLDDSSVVELYQGVAITAFYADELTHYSEYAINYVRTRLRSTGKYKAFFRASLNPDPNHFVLKYLDRYINEEGFAIKEYSGKMAYFVFDKGQIITSWDYNELKELYPDKNPQNYTFIPSSLSDNKYLGQDYADALAANDTANYEMLLRGNWKYKPPTNGFWTRDVLKVVDQEPVGCTYFRCYDKASSKPASEGGDSKQKDPDYTCSIMGAKDKEGNLYLLGSYTRDAEERQRARFREHAGQRDQLIEYQALKDGVDVIQYMPVDPGQAGKVEYQESAKRLQNLGFVVKPDPNPTNKSKKTRFMPFCSACFNGQVYFVKNTFDKDVWDYMLLELENFDGDKNSGYHDDLVDVISMAYAVCISSKTYSAPAILPINAPTSISNMSRMF